jgi:type VI secretion system protein ImpA
MPLRNDLLNPISPENPTGSNLRYDPLYDKIKEARREDADDPQGEWKRERKLADWTLTINLIGDALATKTKDLQLAVWLAQAMLRRDGFQDFREGLDLVRKYLQTFWDGIYPEMEDGDLEVRVAPLEWLATESDREPDRPVSAIKMVRITNGTLDWNKYRESRDDVGTEEAASDSYEKQQARERKIAEGKVSPEKFDKEFGETPKLFYAEMERTLDGTLESISQLSTVCDEKFGDVSPSFGTLRKGLEEIRQTIHILLMRKREKEPDEVQVAETPAAAEVSTEAGAGAGVAVSPTKATLAKKPMSLAAMPENWEDAVARVVSAAKFMRQQYPYNPAPYLMLRGLRWGELRASGTSIDQNRLAAPPTELRQSLKRAALDSNWAEVLETVETGMGMECGRGWLDLQRYLARACDKLGGYYEQVRRAVIAELQSLLDTYPKLPEMTMMDDMPTANQETLVWLKKQVLSNSSEDGGGHSEATSPALPLRSFDLAMEAARAGRPEAGIELLMREIALEPSGRGRFHRKIQLAHLCLGAGNEAIALPILKQAAAEIEEKKLEEWEPREALAYPLGLFYRCLVKTDGSTDERERLYSWICRLDPLEAMKLEK